ncbi:MAG: ABC transporter permease [Bacteroidetes bacterium]|nr:MAG: ABC transporter permease [Bacteroidota bacterium]
MLVKMAWRNIWRNKRRTLITMASIFFAVILAVLMRSANTGIYEHMVHNVVSFSSGYIQVHKKGYWEEQSIDNSFNEDKSIYGFLEEQPDITEYVPRLESFALASSADKIKGVLVLGVVPEKEKNITHLDERIVVGRYIRAGDRSLILSEGLAAGFGIDVGDTIVLLSQGYHGASAAGKYPVSGIVQLGSPELNKRLVSMPLELMQEMYGAEGLISSVSLMMAEGSDMVTVKEKIIASTDTLKYEIMDWKQMLPELDQIIEGDLAGDYIVIGTLYLVIAFGVFGTILMMTRERMHEFGILVAIGMKKSLLARVVILESFFISFIAALAGMIGAMPVILWFKENPIRIGGELKKIYDTYGMEAIIPFSNKAHVFSEQAVIVFFISLVLSLYAARKVYGLNAIEAIRS